MVVALGLFWFSDNVLPETNHQLQTLRRSIGRKSPTFALNARSVNEVIERELFLEAQTGRPADQPPARRHHLGRGRAPS